MVAFGPVVAGSFYPADPAGLKAHVRRLLDDADTEPADGPCGLIVPHAGYVYSGPVAASAFAVLDEERFDRVVLIGPSHFVWFPGVAAPEADTWATPLGEFPIAVPPDLRGVERIQDPFSREHCLEVQLPFLHEVLGPLPITPLLTGDVTPRQVAVVLGKMVDRRTLLVVSTDLSHYLPYDDAVRKDHETIEAIEAGEPMRLARESACGLIGLQAALILAGELGWSARLLDYRNSGDTAGDRARVVGYGALTIGPGNG